jgi:hypothetical protein
MRSIPTEAGAQAGSQGNAPNKANSAPSAPSAQVRAQRWIVGILLNEPNRWAAVQKVVHLDDLAGADEQVYRVAETLWAQQRDEGEPVLSEFLSTLDDPLKAVAVELVQEVEALPEIDTTLADSIAFIERLRHRENERKLVAESRRISEEQDDAARELLRQLSEQKRRPDVGRT